MFLDLSKYINFQRDNIKISFIDLNIIRRVSIYHDEDEEEYRIFIKTNDDELISLNFEEEEIMQEALQDLKERITKGRYIY